uniref:Uncharacterized protein n=1 Tax=Siphoviridae sp. ctCIj3 TaxID=2826192 RepID=A0A8S5MMY5_9CAUD|nr:MAG TPA: hypothetical protein [Siphoviridae sp. ctCIj3]DAU73411.1 MAG TPA: hypothetical protein [Caudoviricetes sp.]
MCLIISDKNSYFSRGIGISRRYRNKIISSCLPPNQGRRHYIIRGYILRW